MFSSGSKEKNTACTELFIDKNHKRWIQAMYSYFYESFYLKLFNFFTICSIVRYINNRTYNNTNQRAFLVGLCNFIKVFYMN